MLVLKSDTELFQDLPDRQNSAQWINTLLYRQTHDEVWMRTFGGKYHEAARRYSAEIIERRKGEILPDTDKDLQMAIENDAREVFRRLQSWIEGCLWEGVSIGVFPEPVITLYTVGYEKKPCQVDFFRQLEHSTGRLTDLARPLRETVEVLEPWGKKILGCLLRCFLWLLGACFAITVGTSTKQTAVTLGSMVVMAVCLFQALRTLLTRPRRVKKKKRRQATAEFRRLAEENLPRMHLLLRFYTLWAEYEQIALPDNVQEMQRFFDEMVARYEEGS